MLAFPALLLGGYVLGSASGDPVTDIGGGVVVTLLVTHFLLRGSKIAWTLGAFLSCSSAVMAVAFIWSPHAQEPVSLIPMAGCFLGAALCLATRDARAWVGLADPSRSAFQAH